jgi:hypothetical protein
MTWANPSGTSAEQGSCRSSFAKRRLRRELAESMQIDVKCYSGYKADEQPLRFVLNGREYEVREVEDRWYSPQATYFRVVASDANRYVLRHDEAADVWSLEGFRASGRSD